MPALLQEATLPSGQFESLEALTRTFLTSIQRLNDPRIDQAVFGVPGPVMGAQAQITNLPWSVDANSLERALNTPSVTLLNDLEATAYGTRHLPQTALVTVAAALSTLIDPTPVILSAAVNRECPLCERTLELFLDILAAAASSLALTVLSTGGVFLGGGILPRTVSAINADRFVGKFHQKGRTQRFVSQIPVSIILEPKTVLLGAAC